MHKISEVESAKALMTEATNWSVMKWLRERSRVRQAADQANAVLDRRSESVKQDWPENIRAAYNALGENGTAQKKPKQACPSPDAEIVHLVKRIKEADAQAWQARVDAEKTFDDAERKLSTTLAREGCRKAILAWDLHEKAIQKAISLNGN